MRASGYRDGGLNSLKLLGTGMAQCGVDSFPHALVRDAEEAELLSEALGVRFFRGQAEVDNLHVALDEGKVRALLED